MLPPGCSDGVTTIAVGAAGALTAPQAGAALAELLVAERHVDVLVSSDVVTAHVGALAGRPGTVLVAGTGAVAVGIGSDGDLRRVDGAGRWLGDTGSGRWIGQHGLAAAIRAADGRGPSTSLLEQALLLEGSIDRLPAVIGGADAPERAMAAFAPAVLDAAASGDAVSTTIRDRAVIELVTTCRAAVAEDNAEIAVIGGLTKHDDFAQVLAAALGAAGLTVLAPAGDALDGAARLAIETSLPHERQVTRVRAPHP
ncbi:BadF/BadG/BcrA/BcrD ATPase family protein [Curtobacterium sp. A7_M15]|uniref:N-acetylglucosamine kinase n=1 Tax=Curtobacterium sp. A7_M15 TaxID=3065241 RepID=UPI002737EE6B|nr:BadF/BadG/BcrA/BcrD ATPase family protein [Curtobacterium sp. A7_M15]MDP4331962.1 BadF/BadG/BcrA/BcrD ATPase family protein [Curtobacterium sp. A7_M15]